MSTAGFQVGGRGRRCLGWLLILGAVVAVVWSRRLDWGMAPIVWVPALFVALIGWGLRLSWRLEVDGRHLLVREQGLLGRRYVMELGRDSELEQLPTAGLTSLVLHSGGREIPLATWTTPRRAAAISAWLEDALGRELPRRRFRAHRLDR